MQTGIAWLLLAGWGGLGLVGCAPAEQAAAPHHESSAQRNKQIEREQRALDRRLVQLENQALSELRKLRESRQASTGAAEPTRDDDAEASADDELMILGGAKHEVFLGCL